MPRNQRRVSRNTPKTTGRKGQESVSVNGAGRNQLRIIAGEWRGRKLPFPDGEGLRPTGDRLRETVFNWLSLSIYSARVLDLFTGSGALGLEALSRGAGSATFLDTHNGVIRQMQDNLRLLQCNKAEVIQQDAILWLKSPADSHYDLVFLDPPFGQNLLLPACQLLEEKHWLSEDALIYLEAEKTLDFNQIPDNWVLQKEKRTGQVICRLYQRNAVM
ncbi:16S rRNA (guanine(966)-N(2))-methyltransferase RsmD [Oceanospirillum sp. D5]|uniref:Ribosomal RNA small subunit methyltransferase D n=1 Tax=Oceanospirillum sediminis TaxID=2760088 RepID=A0A839IVJ3_9GAMM|nr:16S rRNA (guanine(966)-N(2))-methyltransferase RsmD [Oceanospirillum sediminis]